MSALARESRPARFSERFTSEIYLRVENTGGDHVGNLIDVSDGGMRLLAHQRAQIGDRCSLIVYLPTNHGEADRVPVEAEVRWSIRATNPSLYEVGLRFDRIDHADVTRLIAIVKSYGELL